MKLKQTYFAALVLMALTACKNNVKETADIIDLPRAETPDSVAQALDGFFEQAASDSMDIHSVMIVRDGSVIYSRWQSEGMDTVPHVLHSVSKTFPCHRRRRSTPYFGHLFRIPERQKRFTLAHRALANCG